jgi:NlpC/P60 family
MSNTRESLRRLANETSQSKDPNQKNFAKNLKVVEQSVARVESIPRGQRTAGQQMALQALQTWSGNPNAFATTTTRPGRFGMGELSATDSNGSDLKCNRFVAEMAGEAGFNFPVDGLNPFNRYARGADGIYNKGIENSQQVNAKNAKIGDVISFEGHVGIYLGNGLYVSARSSNDYYGSQTNNGVQVTKVPWEQNPKVYRLNGMAMANSAGNAADGTEVATTGSQQGATNGTNSLDTQNQGQQETASNASNTEATTIINNSKPSSVQALTERLGSTSSIASSRRVGNLMSRANGGVPVESVSTVDESTGAMTGRAEVVVPESSNNRRELGRGR